MTVQSRFERRISLLVDAYADRAPRDFDPFAVARAAASSRRGYGSVLLPSMQPAWAVFAAIGLLLALLGSALIVGGQLFRHSQERWLAEPVPPFIGLPPLGADPSEPEEGELVLDFGARMPMLGMEAHGGFLYADGRLIWHRNLDGNNLAEANLIFGDLPPTNAVIEQRLSPEGVELIRQEVLAHRGPENGQVNKPGTWPWGWIDIVIDGRLQPIDWDDARLPVRLADPGSWLPPSAWADRTLRGYVPSRYAICPTPEVVFSELPATVARRLRADDAFPGPGEPRVDTCYAVTTTVAREIEAAFEAAGVERIVTVGMVGYRLRVAEECCDSVVNFLEILPDGQEVGRGG
jgi:hypothetical protein